MWAWNFVLSATACLPALVPAPALAQSKPTTQKAGKIMPTGRFAIDDIQDETISERSDRVDVQAKRLKRLELDLGEILVEGQSTAISLSIIETKTTLTIEDADEALCEIQAVLDKPCEAVNTQSVTCVGSASCREWVSSLSTGEQFILTEVERRQILDAMGYDFITGSLEVFDYRTATPEVGAIWDKFFMEVLTSRVDGQIGTGRVQSVSVGAGGSFSDRQVCTGDHCEHNLNRAQREEIANRMGYKGAFGRGRFEAWRNETPERQQQFKKLLTDFGRNK